MIYYQHLEDTDGETPFSIGETRVVRNVQRWLGQRPAPPIVNMIHGNSSFCKDVLRDGKLEVALSAYEPCWFYVNPVVAGIMSVMHGVYKPIEFESHKIFCEEGLITHDYVRSSKNPESQKVVLVMPGANSDIEMNHVRAIVKQADKRGYHAIVVNSVTPPQADIKDLATIDYRQDEAVARSLAVTREIFGQDIEVYAVGLSLGSNFLLRHMGSHVDCSEKCKIKAVVSISGAFDLAATTVDMRKPAFGLIDSYVLRKFKSVLS